MDLGTRLYHKPGDLSRPIEFSFFLIWTQEFSPLDWQWDIFVNLFVFLFFCFNFDFGVYVVCTYLDQR